MIMRSLFLLITAEIFEICIFIDHLNKCQITKTGTANFINSMFQIKNSMLKKILLNILILL